MKVALLMTGKVGKFFYENRISSIWSNMVKKYDIDVFLLTDDDNYYHPFKNIQVFSEKNREKYVTNNNEFRKSINTTHLSYSETNELFHNLFKEYFDDRLKYLSVLDSNFKEDFLVTNQSQKTFFEDKESGRSYENKVGLLNQFYKLEKCFDIMCNYEQEKNIQYDVIIRTRFDCRIDFNLEIDFQNKIYCGFCGQNNHIYDWWAIGDRYIMSEYCKYYTQIGDFIMKGKKSIIMWNGYPHDISDSSEVGLTEIIRNKSYSVVDMFGYFVDKSY